MFSELLELSSHATSPSNHHIRSGGFVAGTYGGGARGGASLLQPPSNFSTRRSNQYCNSNNTLTLMSYSSKNNE